MADARPSFTSTVGQIAAAAFKYVYVALPVAIVLFAVFQAKELTTDKIIFREIVVPKDLVDRGITPAVLSRMFVDQLNRTVDDAHRGQSRRLAQSQAEKIEQSAEDGDTDDENQKQQVVTQTQAAIPRDVSIAGVSFPLEQFLEPIKEMLGHADTIVEGELIHIPMPLTCVIEMEKSKSTVGEPRETMSQKYSGCYQLTLRLARPNAIIKRYLWIPKDSACGPDPLSKPVSDDEDGNGPTSETRSDGGTAERFGSGDEEPDEDRFLNSFRPIGGIPACAMGEMIANAVDGVIGVAMPVVAAQIAAAEEHDPRPFLEKCIKSRHCPQGERVRALIQQLEYYLNEEKFDVADKLLAKMTPRFKLMSRSDRVSTLISYSSLLARQRKHSDAIRVYAMAVNEARLFRLPPAHLLRAWRTYAMRTNRPPLPGRTSSSQTTYTSVGQFTTDDHRLLLRVVDQALKNKEPVANQLDQLAVTLRTMRQWDLHQEVSERRIRLSPDNSFGYLQRAVGRLELDDRRGSLLDLRLAADLATNDVSDKRLFTFGRSTAMIGTLTQRINQHVINGDVGSALDWMPAMIALHYAKEMRQSYPRKLCPEKPLTRFVTPLLRNCSIGEVTTVRLGNSERRYCTVSIWSIVQQVEANLDAEKRSLARALGLADTDLMPERLQTSAMAELQKAAEQIKEPFEEMGEFAQCQAARPEED